MGKLMIMQDESGYYVAENVPMNNFPNCSVFFWQQMSKYYHYKKNAEKVLSKIKKDRAMKIINQ